MAACLPVVDEGRNEVDTWFVGHHEVLLQAASHAEAVGAKLVGWLHLVVETNVFLVERLHVMHVKTHHVSKSVRQEHGMCTSPYGFLGVALHESELLQFVGHQTAYIHVHVIPFHSRFSHVEGIVVTSLHDGVYLALTLVKLSTDRHCAGVVGAIVIQLATGIAQCKASGLKQVHRRIAVHNLAMLTEYCGEAHLG